MRTRCPVRIVLDPNATSVCLDDRLADRKPKAYSLSGHLLSALHLMKFEEDFVLLLVGHAGAGVGDGNEDSFGGSMQARHNFAVRWREFQTILEQVSEHLHDPISIALGRYRGEIAFEAHPNLLLACLNIKFFDYAL